MQWLQYTSVNGLITNKNMVSLRRYLKQLLRLSDLDATHHSISNGILTGELFGVLLCDIHTPDHLKEHFSEFCPI